MQSVKRIGVAKAKEHVRRQPPEPVEKPSVAPPPKRDLKPFDDMDDLQDA